MSPVIMILQQLILRMVAVSTLLATLTLPLQAADSPWTNSNRIAISTDGNPDADADDVGATPFTLAVLAKAGLQDNLVHYNFNNFLEYKKIDSGSNRMWLGAIGGQTRWGFDRDRFFDATLDPDGAIAHLAAEINKSTQSDPLYLVVGGPMELIYRALEAANSSARQHVIIVSHHNYNEYFKPRLWQRNWNDVKALVPNIGYLRIVDQNNGLKGSADSDFHWLRDHADPNLNWVYTRVVAGKPDVSDSGMITWLIGINGNDELTSLSEMQTWFGSSLVPTNGGHSNAPAAPAGVTPEVIPPATQSIFQEVDGRIVIEAESVPLTDEWILDSTEPGYSGTGYIRWMPSWIGKISHQHEGVLIYKLRITNPGNYRMAMRSSHKGAPERDKWNDCWTVMGLNPVSPYGVTRKTYHSISQTEFDNGVGFSWHTTHDNYGAVASSDGHFSQPVYNLSAGDHYFWICGRSGGFRIDQIQFVMEGVSGFKSDSLLPTPILPGDSPEPETDTTRINPIDDAYLEGSTPYNDTLLKVENANRLSYLKFDIPEIDETILSIKLQLTASGDAGSGTIRVYQGDSNAWTETTLSTANAPALGTELASYTGTIALDDTIEIDLGTTLPSVGEYTYVLTMDAGGNDVWFASKEGATKPELVIKVDPLPLENTVDNSMLPSSIETASSFDVQVAYEAATSRDIVLEFWGSTGWLANNIVTVPAGSGMADLTITLASGAPTPGSGYYFKTSNRPVGGAWNAPGVVAAPSRDVTLTAAMISYDDWATSHSLAGDNREATRDLDGDGQSNEAEYLSLTDPMDPNSHFKVTSMVQTADTSSQLTITWDSKEDRIYTIYKGDTPNIGNDQIAADNLRYPSNSYTLDIDQTKCFFKLAVSLP